MSVYDLLSNCFTLQMTNLYCQICNLKMPVEFYWKQLQFSVWKPIYKEPLLEKSYIIYKCVWRVMEVQLNRHVMRFGCVEKYVNTY